MDQTILITGAGRGLGRAIAGEFHSRGWQVIATDADPGLLADLRGKEGYLPLVMDVCSDASVKGAFEQAVKAFNTIDLLVNNAGIDRYFPFSGAPVSHFIEIFEVNLFGAFRVNQVFLPLVKRPGGKIIHIGSESLHLALPFMPYPITKKALDSYALALRQELWFVGISVSVIRSGAIRTGILEGVHSITNPVAGSRLQKQFENFAAGASREVPVAIRPEEVARLVFSIALTRRPKAIYRINNSWKLKLMKIVPFRVVERIVRWRIS